MSGADFIPHDPVHAEGETGCSSHRARGESCACNICGTEWPCAIRKEQRAEIKYMVDYLKSDLYERAPCLPDDPEGIRWASPLGWSVFLTYGERSVVGAIRDPAGKPRSSTTNATVQWLESDLP